MKIFFRNIGRVEEIRCIVELEPSYPALDGVVFLVQQLDLARQATLIGAVTCGVLPKIAHRARITALGACEEIGSRWDDGTSCDWLALKQGPLRNTARDMMDRWWNRRRSKPSKLLVGKRLA